MGRRFRSLAAFEKTIPWMFGYGGWVAVRVQVSIPEYDGGIVVHFVTIEPMNTRHGEASEWRGNKQDNNKR